MNPERLDAALRLLLYAGDITPVAARMLTRINDEEQPDPDPQHLYCDCPDCLTSAAQALAHIHQHKEGTP